MCARDQIGIRITFDGLTRAEATRAVQDLQRALRDRTGDEVAATIESEDAERQDAGTTLVLLFGTASAVAVAHGIRAYLARWADQRDQITITTIDGTTLVATGEPARRLDPAMLLRAVRGSKIAILFLAANPVDTDRLALDREAREIQVELERSGHRDRFELLTRWAAEPLDLLRELRTLKPTVVHVSGHGGPPGLLFQDRDGRARLVSSAALAETFEAAGSSVKLVVLSACHSDVHARALLDHVDCVIGIGDAIDGASARTFAIGFYGGVGSGESIGAGFRQGCAAIRLEGLRDGDRPRLEVRGGVDATRLFLLNPR